MEAKQAPTHGFQLLAGLTGVVGSLILVGSFAMNPAPPPSLGAEALTAWARAREGRILLGGWMQGIGSLLIVVVAFCLVELRPGASQLAERLTRLAGSVILMVSLTEITFYIAAAHAAATADQAVGMASVALIKAVQHVFLIAPALLLPLGIFLLRSRVLPRAFALSGLALGATLQILGVVGLLADLQSVVDAILIVQSLWFVVAGVAVAIGPAAGSRSPHSLQASASLHRP